MSYWPRGIADREWGVERYDKSIKQVSSMLHVCMGIPSSVESPNVAGARMMDHDGS